MTTRITILIKWLKVKAAHNTNEMIYWWLKAIKDVYLQHFPITVIMWRSLSLITAYF